MGRENILKKKFKCSCTIVNCCNNQSGKQLAPSIKLRQGQTSQTCAPEVWDEQVLSRNPNAQQQ